MSQGRIHTEIVRDKKTDTETEAETEIGIGKKGVKGTRGTSVQKERTGPVTTKKGGVKREVKAGADRGEEATRGDRSRDIESTEVEDRGIQAHPVPVSYPRDHLRDRGVINLE